MIVTFVSQCEKKALLKTRRVLDAYANRIGNNVWQTIITEEGLQMVKKLLRSSASKNSAISCHWIRSRRRTDLLWVVGNRQKFNAEGHVPVNFTESEISEFMDSEKWQNLAIVQDAVTIAGLFHDFGKSTVLFQAKLKGNGKSNHEPIRHEWVSLRIFQAFVGSKTDEQWLNSLAEIDKNHQDTLFKDGVDVGKNNPLANLPPLAQLIGWLILSHHKLPFVPTWKKNLCAQTTLHELRAKKVTPRAAWFETELHVHWNSYHFKDENTQEFLSNNWVFHADGLPYKSAKWRYRAMKAADKALLNLKQIEDQNVLHDDLFTSHLARMALMLADHYYSAQEEVNPEWQSPHYAVFANTNRKTGELKQQLDEHLIGVAKSAFKIVQALPRLESSLLSLQNNSFLSSTKIKNEKFAWQILAQKEAKKLSETSAQQGFFGINMASTGTGKTLANAKIMYALADEKEDSRFTVALGLRTLTLQTGREYRKQLALTDEQLAIAVGGTASKILFENEQNKHYAEEIFGSGSESAEDFLDSGIQLDYDLSGVEHALYEWTRHNVRIEKLLQAPVLVCTIDHLIPATDGTKGGKQIGPMLRLLTSDLIIDEPDDFGLEDLPALCRLVYWAGMLGSRVLLSTATMPPDLAFAAFQAYQNGWAQYAKANVVNWNQKINCAWFDERTKSGALSQEIQDFKVFKSEHEKYVAKRIEYLAASAVVKHKGKILENTQETDDVYNDFSKTILQGALALHQHNHVQIDCKKISIGLVRMANINPLVAVAKALSQQLLPPDTHIHLCVYHSRYPLAVRSYLENQLDRALNRKENWPPNDIKKLVQDTQARQQIFIVLASPVAEVGRDHDYDWAIIEPSSMRSIIQIAGRVLRHRDIQPKQENVFLINQNMKQLKGRDLCFSQPGFEVEKMGLKLHKHQLNEVLQDKQYQHINAIERVVQPKDKHLENLVALEHKALLTQLFTDTSSASLWWKEQAHWCGVLQHFQPFRKSKKDESLYLLVNDNGLLWQWKNEDVFPPKLGTLAGAGIEIQEESIDLAPGISFWFDLNPEAIYEALAADLKTDAEDISRRFGELRLISYESNDINQYQYSTNLGVYQEVK